MDFRRPGRPLVFGPDIPNHALVDLRSGLKQSCPTGRALSVRSTPAATTVPHSVSSPGPLF